MWNDFKAFVLRGNVLDLAVAVIIGGAFGKIITSLVNDMIMPLVGLALGGVFDETAFDEVFEGFGPLLAIEFGRLVLGDQRHHLHRRDGAVRRLAHRHLNARDAERPDVRFAVVILNGAGDF